MKRRQALALGVVTALAIAAFAARSITHAPSPPPAAPSTATAPSSVPASAFAHPEIGFASPAQALEHFRRHGREFGAIDLAAYLRLAQRLRDAPRGGPILELQRADGTLTRFDRASGAFVAFDPDRTLRTFFKPADGERYFVRQAEREH